MSFRPLQLPAREVRTVDWDLAYVVNHHGGAKDKRPSLHLRLSRAFAAKAGIVANLTELRLEIGEDDEQGTARLVCGPGPDTMVCREPKRGSTYISLRLRWDEAGETGQLFLEREGLYPLDVIHVDTKRWCVFWLPGCEPEEESEVEG